MKKEAHNKKDITNKTFGLLTALYETIDQVISMRNNGHLYKEIDEQLKLPKNAARRIYVTHNVV